jgi:transposase
VASRTSIKIGRVRASPWGDKEASCKTGYRRLLGYARPWPRRVWAVEGAGGVGRPLAARLLADGEVVVDVPAKLAARVRVFDTGQGRKTDATDADSIVMAALRTRRLRQLAVNEELAVLRLLADRRDELSRTRVQTLNRLHRLLAELIPGGASRHLTALQAKTLLASVRPRDLPGGGTVTPGEPTLHYPFTASLTCPLRSGHAQRFPCTVR